MDIVHDAMYTWWMVNDWQQKVSFESAPINVYARTESTNPNLI